MNNLRPLSGITAPEAWGPPKGMFSLENILNLSAIPPRHLKKGSDLNIHFSLSCGIFEAEDLHPRRADMLPNLKQLQLLVCILSCAITAYGQGTLTPAAAPSPTMKTLQQVEPRFPVSNDITSLTIKDPGSYYLTENLTNTVSILSSDVTLDLMGFYIKPDGGDGISIGNDLENIRIHNGLISAPSDGVYGKSALGAPHILEDLRIHGCGTAGIRGTSGWIVRNCTITDNPGTGLRLGGSNNLAANNIVKENGLNYYFGSDNKLNLLLCEIPVDIYWPAHITLAGTLTLPISHSGTNGISVRANHVTIDLNGHGLIGQDTAALGAGIFLAPESDALRVHNGSIAKWQTAITATPGSFKKAVFEQIIATGNNLGISTPGGSKILHCTTSGNIGNGIASSHSIIESCIAVSNSYGITAEDCTIQECTASHNRNAGIEVTQCLVENSRATDNGTHGFTAITRNRILSCIALDNGGAGFRAVDTQNEFDSNRSTRNDFGFRAPTANNFFHRNVAHNNTNVNYSLVVGNIGNVVLSPVGAGAWDNFSY